MFTMRPKITGKVAPLFDRSSPARCINDERLTATRCFTSGEGGWAGPSWAGEPGDSGACRAGQAPATPLRYRTSFLHPGTDDATITWKRESDVYVYNCVNIICVTRSSGWSKWAWSHNRQGKYPVWLFNLFTKSCLFLCQFTNHARILELICRLKTRIPWSLIPLSRIPPSRSSKLKELNIWTTK